MCSDDAPPPAYIHTVYDETYRAKSYLRPTIVSMANRPNLLAHLEHHTAQTDGSFAICVASGNGVFVSQEALDSIPAAHRPALDTTLAGQAVQTMVGPAISTGTTFFPFLLTDAQTGQRMRLVLYAIVVPALFVGMFIGRPNDFWLQEEWSPLGVMFTFDFGEGGGVRRVKGM